MKTIWKFPLQVADLQPVEMPVGAQVLCVQEQFGRPCLWATVDPDEKRTVMRHFRIAGTGHSLGSGVRLAYIGTFQVDSGALVFHVFEVAQ